MLNRWVLSGLAGALVFTLVACESATLIELNKDFVALSQQTNEARELHDTGALDAANFESAIEGYRAAFAENAKKAKEAAGEAKTAQNKASFLNVAVRSYLRSGALGDTEIPDLAEQGKTQCRSDEMKGLNALPVTCGYFHLVVPQAVNDEAIRRLTALKAKAKELRRQDKLLSADDGKELHEKFGLLLDQITELDTASEEIVWADVDPKFKAFFDRQRVIFFCNARDTRLLLIKRVVADGADWSREDVSEETKVRLDKVQKALKISSPTRACTT